MVTAAERQAAADAKRPTAAQRSASLTSRHEYDEVADRAELALLDDKALRTEAKRLLGPDYDHSMDFDRDALTTAAVQERKARHNRAEDARLAQVGRLRARLADLEDDDGEA